jgi:hypothetical protein
MSGQRFRASADTFTWSNGAVGHRPGGSFDCLGPYAKVTNCPVLLDGVEVARRTCYATGYADTFWSVPACCKVAGQRVAGYFTSDDSGVTFRVMDRHRDRVAQLVRT